MERKKIFALNSLLCFVHHLNVQAVGGKKNLLASKISLLLVFQCVGRQEPDVMWPGPPSLTVHFISAHASSHLDGL